MTLVKSFVIKVYSPVPKFLDSVFAKKVFFRETGYIKFEFIDAVFAQKAFFRENWVCKYGLWQGGGG
jgi:hypothetical protein